MLLSVLLALSAAAAEATHLFVADYSGQVLSLCLDKKEGDYSLTKSSVSKACAPNPSWLTLDSDNGVLYCMNEGLNTPNGSLSTFTVNADASLNHIQNTTTPKGPVNGNLYGNPSGPRGIVLAHYDGSAVSSWRVDNNGSFTFNEAMFYTLAQPSPDPDRQDAPHEHEAILDPTGQYVLVPDLGADLVRVFSYNAKTLKLQTQDPLHAAAGSGPRHAAFYKPSNASDSATYFYLAAELAGTVTAYEVTYKPNNSGLTFTKLSTQPAIGPSPPPQRNAPAEILVSPDNRFLIISNRNDTSSTLPSGKVSDSITTFRLAPQDGSLEFVQRAAAGGSFPRHVSTNAQGDLLAVGLQNDDAVVVLSRDVKTGKVGGEVARLAVGGDVTCVVWDQ